MKIEIPDHLIKEIIKNELKFIFNVEEDDMVKFGLETYDSYVEKVFNDPEFIEMVELMFYDDYKIFGYPLQYLT